MPRRLRQAEAQLPGLDQTQSCRLSWRLGRRRVSLQPVIDYLPDGPWLAVQAENGQEPPQLAYALPVKLGREAQALELACWFLQSYRGPETPQHAAGYLERWIRRYAGRRVAR